MAMQTAYPAVTSAQPWHITDHLDAPLNPSTTFRIEIQNIPPMAPLTMIHFVDGRGDGRPS
ncbi:UNVERIFIED_CONTAM: hypothetical protein NY603_31625, partial [Bacteroidetes bacterium 56_B9]